MRRLTICLLLFGCHSAPRDSSPATRPTAALTGAPCAVTTGAAGAEPWREVRTPSFTFCVPAAWKSLDPRSGHAWRGEGVEIRWTTSQAREMTVTRERVAIVSGENPDLAMQRMVEESRRELREVNEVIGGHAVRLIYNHTQGTYFASAEWERPTLRFSGTAGTLGGAARAMEIYRTVRFEPADSAAAPAGR